MLTMSSCISKNKCHIQEMPYRKLYIYIIGKNWNAPVEIEFKKYEANNLITDLNNDPNPVISISLSSFSLHKKHNKTKKSIVVQITSRTCNSL